MYLNIVSRVRICVVVLLVLGVVFAGVPVFAQEGTAVVDERRQALQADLDAILAEIEAQSVILQDKQRERVSLERDVAILNASIERARLSIQARDIRIRQLTGEIGDKELTIEELNEKMERERESLAQLLRRTNEIDDYTIVEIVLGNQNLSDFFEDLDTFDSIKLALQDSFVEIEDTKASTQVEKSALVSTKSQEVELRNLQELEKQKIEEQEAERSQILAATRGEEEAYQALIRSKEKTAAEIRSELFRLRDSAAIPFGEALELAQRAERATGVRAALILGILKQETNIGENLGTGTWTSDMHPTRDQPVFPYITQALGLDPNQMPVSRKPSYGWGGAMGPSQFIPSTWVCYGGFINVHTGDCANSARSMSWDAFWQGPWEYSAAEDRIRQASGGNSPSNPWENKDAFMATALLMKDNGARGTRESERLAALRYFAGWVNASNPSYAFYGDGVMDFADDFQRQIDILNAS